MISPEEYLRRVNDTYGAPKFQEEIDHRTRHNKCCLASCHVTHNLNYCSRCKIRKYCCRDHQQAEWDVHKQYCRIPVVDLPGPEVQQCPARYDHKWPHSARQKLATVSADRLIKCIHADMYPLKDEELIYGIEMGDSTDRWPYIGIDFPLGKLMYNAWKFLYGAYIDFESASHDASVLFKQHFAKAILRGELPLWFQMSIKKYRELYLQKKLHVDAYVEELLRREMKGIKWDNKLLEMLKVWPSDDHESDSDVISLAD